MPPKQQLPCPHDNITYTPSPHATQVNYHQPSKQERQNATKPAPSSSSSSSSSKRKSSVLAPPTRTDSDNFPAPLVLPGDDLALDPEYPPQSFQEWLDEEERNPVTQRRKTIYFVEAPSVDSRVSEVEAWTRPNVPDLDSHSHSHSAGDAEVAVAVAVAPPASEDVTDYLAAFFHGLPVKHLNMPKGRWKFTPWIDDEDEDTPPPTKRPKRRNQTSTPTPTPKHIALTTPTEQIRIRTRACPDGLYSRQLNLDDLLDVAIAILPKDAYALCMLVNHDLYEDDEDSFVCGRAYGGSRVAVVSAARYNPVIDGVQGVERGHAWPGSHCGGFVENVCREWDCDDRRKKKKKTAKGKDSSNEPAAAVSLKRGGPLEDAMHVLRQAQPQSHSHSHSVQMAGDGESQWQSALWLWRIIRTTSHELCHCLGIDHCVYYACIMQGSASLSEDTRQPPYLCPVDLAKVLCATGSGVEERDRALLRYCDGEKMRGFVYSRAFAAWLRSSLGSGNGVDGNQEVIVIDD